MNGGTSCGDRFRSKQDAATPVALRAPFVAASRLEWTHFGKLCVNDVLALSCVNDVLALETYCLLLLSASIASEICIYLAVYPG
jgi:hypothetical protein